MTTAEVSFSRQQLIELAVQHDKRVRQIEKQVTAAWSELAEIATQVQDNEEWRALGFHSFGAWLCDAAPRSRSLIYSAMGLLKELADIPRDDLREIPVGNAHILKKLPKSSRASRDVLEDAKALTPREMLAMVAESHPTLILEKLAVQRFQFSVSQWLAIEAAIDEIMAQYDGQITTREEAIEGICAEWRLAQ